MRTDWRTGTHAARTACLNALSGCKPGAPPGVCRTFSTDQHTTYPLVYSSELQMYHKSSRSGTLPRTNQNGLTQRPVMTRRCACCPRQWLHTLQYHTLHCSAGSTPHCSTTHCSCSRTLSMDAAAKVCWAGTNLHGTNFFQASPRLINAPASLDHLLPRTTLLRSLGSVKLKTSGLSAWSTMHHARAPNLCACQAPSSPSVHHPD